MAHEVKAFCTGSMNGRGNNQNDIWDDTAADRNHRKERLPDIYKAMVHIFSVPFFLGWCRQSFAFGAVSTN